MSKLSMCCVVSLCLFKCAVCLYVCMYIQVCLLFPPSVFFSAFLILVFFCLFGHLRVVCWVAVASLGPWRTRTTQFGCFCFLFVSFIFCLCCWWSLLLLFLFLAGEWQFVVWLVLCLASTRLGKTVTPTAGRDCPPVKAPLKPLGLWCLLKPYIFPDSPGLGLVRQDTPP